MENSIVTLTKSLSNMEKQSLQAEEQMKMLKMLKMLVLENMQNDENFEIEMLHDSILIREKIK